MWDSLAPRSLRMSLQDQPLIRFGKRATHMRSAPLIRFGKRDGDGMQWTWVTASEEGNGGQKRYARFSRNRRPNPVEEEDTMLRFG